MAEHKCPNCGYPLKTAIYPDKRRASQQLKSGLMQSTAPAIPRTRLGQLIHALRGRSLWPNLPTDKAPPPYVEMITRLDGKIKRDKITGMTDEEFDLVAYATYQNDWRFSATALQKYGGFSQYRAKEIADLFSQAGLRYVTPQNWSVLLPRTLAHLRRALPQNLGAQPTNDGFNQRNGA